MASLEEELRLDEEENRLELAYIRKQLPIALKERLSDDTILYMMDAIVDYYYTSGILESDDEEIDIDMEVVAQHVCQQAEQDNVGRFDPSDVLLIVQADLDFQEQQD